jgi:hypothetical protein
MGRVVALALAGMLWLLPCVAKADFNPADYRPATQAELAKNPDASVGKKVSVTDPFQFCGSDFCVQQRMKIDTREHYCFTLGQLCLVRMYIKKDHAQVPAVLALKKGDKVTAYGTFERLGGNFCYLVVDHVAIEKKAAPPK